MASGIDDRGDPACQSRRLQKFQLGRGAWSTWPRSTSTSSCSARPIPAHRVGADGLQQGLPRGWRARRGAAPHARATICNAVTVAHHIDRTGDRTRGAPVWSSLIRPTSGRWPKPSRGAPRRPGAQHHRRYRRRAARQNWETYVRLRRTDKRNLRECHGLAWRPSCSASPTSTGRHLRHHSSGATNLTGTSSSACGDTVKTRWC